MRPGTTTFVCLFRARQWQNIFPGMAESSNQETEQVRQARIKHFESQKAPQAATAQTSTADREQARRTQQKYFNLMQASQMATSEELPDIVSVLLPLSYSLF